MDEVYSMNNFFKFSVALLFCAITQNVFAWGSCGLSIQGQTQVCINQTVTLLAKRTAGDDLGVCSWSRTPGITGGAKTAEGCTATFTGTRAGDFWVTGYYKKNKEYKCNDVTKITVAPGPTCCQIKEVSVTPATILPKQDGTLIPSGENQTQFKVTLNNPAPTGGCSVEVSAEAPFLHAGGHDHDTGDAPVGELSSQLLVIPEGAIDSTVTYKSSFVSGKRRLSANIQGSDRSYITYVDIKVPDLVSLDAGASYRLTGSTLRHGNNHYALSATNTAITNMANSYLASHNATIGINDLSLIEGGLFDVNGNWATPHRSHRKGTSVDMDRCARVVGCPANEPNCVVADIRCEVNRFVNGRRTADSVFHAGYRNFTAEEMEGVCTEAGGHVAREPTHHCEIP